MSNSLHHLSHVAHGVHGALKEVEKTNNPVKGAAYGAIASGGSAATGLALAGLALTPFGWALALGAGAAAGAAYVAGKKKK